MKVSIEKPLTKADIKRLHKWEILLLVLGVCGGLAAIPAFATFLLGGDLETGGICALIALFCGLLFLIITSCTEVNLDDTRRVPLSQCAELLHVFKEWPEVEPYRQAVLNEGREFVTGEIDALKVAGRLLRQEQSDRKKCQALYQA